MPQAPCNKVTWTVTNEADAAFWLGADLSRLSLGLHLLLLCALLQLRLTHRHTRAAVVHVTPERVRLSLLPVRGLVIASLRLLLRRFALFYDSSLRLWCGFLAAVHHVDDSPEAVAFQLRTNNSISRLLGHGLVSFFLAKTPDCGKIDRIPWSSTCHSGPRFGADDKSSCSCSTDQLRDIADQIPSSLAISEQALAVAYFDLLS